MIEQIGKSKDDILEALTNFNFTFDCRHNYTMTERQEYVNDFMYIDVEVIVYLSDDLEDIIDKDILDFGVYDYAGDEIYNDLTDSEILNAININ